MVYRLKTQDNQELCKVEVGVELGDNFIDIRTSINIETYSDYLLKMSPDSNRDEFIKSINEIGDYRNWLWNVYFKALTNHEKHLQHIQTIIKMNLLRLEVQYNLKATL